MWQNVAMLHRIQDVAEQVGLTQRAIRYYEGLGLLTPAARTEGDHRLFDEADVARLRTIKSLRDDAGFSLADIAQLMADEEERVTRRMAYRDSNDPDERRRLIGEELERIGRHVDLLRGKIDRLAGMVGDAEARRARVLEKLAILDASVKDMDR
jgi:DNA-binding transcriptional MerR regulator